MSSSVSQSLRASWLSLSDRDRKILMIGAVAVLVIIGVKYVFFPFLEWREQIKTDLAVQEKMLDKMTKAIANGNKLITEKERIQNLVQKNEGMLIQGDTEDIASAQLIKVVRDHANRAGIQTSRISPIDTKDEENPIKKITVNIPSMRCDMKQLHTFLVSMVNASELLTIGELRIRVTNMKDPTELSVNMEISGYMMKKLDDTKES